MPRPPRLQYPGSIYHLVTRGDGRRTLFHDDGHYARFTQGLSDEVSRSGWIVLAFCWMPNHWHIVLQPTKDGGMSDYLRWVTLTHTLALSCSLRKLWTGACLPRTV